MVAYYYYYYYYYYSLQLGTFSWWATFLSEATEIHFPLAGMFYPYVNPNYMNHSAIGDFTVYDEDRYIIHDPVKRKWWGTYDMCHNTINYRYQTQVGGTGIIPIE